MFTAQAAYHPPNAHDDDDLLPLLPGEEINTQPVQTMAPSNIVKPKIHMANTAYEGGFGAGATNTGAQSLAP